jgi:hypothetical protein
LKDNAVTRLFQRGLWMGDEPISLADMSHQSRDFFVLTQQTLFACQRAPHFVEEIEDERDVCERQIVVRLQHHAAVFSASSRPRRCATRFQLVKIWATNLRS